MALWWAIWSHLRRKLYGFTQNNCWAAGIDIESARTLGGCFPSGKVGLYGGGNFRRGANRFSRLESKTRERIRELGYDGDGNRVQETVAGVTTKYLVGEINPTGYAQVFAELNGTNGLLRGYEWGLQLEAVRDFTVNPNGIFHYYGYDGHGSVRSLTDATGTITDAYDYDAFGNLISSTGTTFNNYLFAGEQFDPALGIYYNRARYYDQRQGRFWSMDDFEGAIDDPPSLHKYLYASGNPVNRIDPTGNADYVDALGWARSEEHTS